MLLCVNTYAKPQEHIIIRLYLMDMHQLSRRRRLTSSVKDTNTVCISLSQ